MRAFTLVMLAILAGCTSAPHESETAPAPASVASPENTAATADDAERGFQPPAGWRAKIVDWEVMYCRRGPIGGSRMTTELCLTEDQLKEHMAANDEMRRDLDRSSRICAADGCSR